MAMERFLMVMIWRLHSVIGWLDTLLMAVEGCHVGDRWKEAC